MYVVFSDVWIVRTLVGVHFFVFSCFLGTFPRECCVSLFVLRCRTAGVSTLMVRVIRASVRNLGRFRVDGACFSFLTGSFVALN